LKKPYVDSKEVLPLPFVFLAHFGVRSLPAWTDVSAATRERLRAEKTGEPTFALTREVEQQMKVIAANRRQAWA